MRTFADPLLRGQRRVYLPTDKEIYKKLILERGNSDIIKLFGYEVNKKKNKFKILESIPKSTDFSYTNIMKKILPLGKPSYNNKSIFSF